MNDKKRPAGAIVFAILIIIGSLLQLPYNIVSARLLLQPLPENIIQIHFFIIKITLLLAIISGVGILCSRNIFRKIAVFLGIFNIVDYFIEIPFFLLRNFPGYINQPVAELTKNSSIPPDVFSTIYWVLTIIGWIIDFGFAVAMVYYFTRRRVKEQFN